MAKDRKVSSSQERNGKDEHKHKHKRKEEEEEEGGEVEEKEAPLKKDRGKKSKRKHESSSEEEEDHSSEKKRSKKKRKRSSKRSSRRRYSDDESSSSSYSEDSESEESDSESESESESSDNGSETEEERRRRKRKEKERKRKKKEKDKDAKERKKKKEGKKGAVTNLWGKYGTIRETDMWNKRPEFTAWLAEVKQVNLESLPNWEEKQMFKEFMEDHNTATFPSKKYYDLDAYHRHKLEKEVKKGMKKMGEKERTIFDDEEQRRKELQIAREKQKEEQVETLKRSMQSGMAQAMKEQAQLREEMAYQYKLGNFEAAAAIQRRLDPDVAM